MPNNYIFVVKSDFDEEAQTRKSARELLSERFAKGVWPLNLRTTHQSEFKAGDRILFYVAGGQESERGLFVAYAELSGPRFVSHRKDESVASWLGLTRKPLYDVPLTDAAAFSKPVAVKPLVPDLVFVKNKQQWGTYFQGGVRKIPEEDLHRILSARE